jgi:hypothetical protein
MGSTHVGIGSVALHRIRSAIAYYRAPVSEVWRDRAMDATGCARMFADFASTTASRAPLYARMAAGVAEDAELASLLLHAPPAQRQPVLLFACVHALLLGGDGEELARYYPNLTSRPDTGDPLPAFRRVCEQHEASLAAMLASRHTQTNEVGRGALLLPAFGLLAAEVGRLAHLDVGTSAGLNLLIDRYRYRYEPGGTVGPSSSPIELECGTRGAIPVPSSIPTIAARLGIDPRPVDVTDDVEARWLEACVWPDQLDRFARLRAAIEMARSAAITVRAGDAVTDTATLAESFAASGHPVVTNTWVLNYLSAEERKAYVEALDELGSRLDLSWVYLESPYLVPEVPGPRVDTAVDRTVLVLVRWRGGQRTVDHLADTHPHGYWMHWK